MVTPPASVRSTAAAAAATRGGSPLRRHFIRLHAAGGGPDKATTHTALDASMRRVTVLRARASSSIQYCMRRAAQLAAQLPARLQQHVVECVHTLFPPVS